MSATGAVVGRKAVWGRLIVALALASAIGAWLALRAADEPPSWTKQALHDSERAGSTAARLAPSEAAPFSRFPVVVGVQPPEAEIWLDGKLVAHGQLSLELPRDGRQHEIRLQADGYVPERLVFVDASPPRDVALNEEFPTEAPAVRRTSSPQRPVHRSPVSSPGETGEHSASSPTHPASPERVTEAQPSAPNLRIIEPEAPQIRVID